MNLKKFAGTAAAMALAALFLLPMAKAASFPDIGGHWAEAAIEEWSGKYGILEGDDSGNFRPNASISRAELATILDRIMSYTEKAPNTFSDLADGLWYTDTLLRLNAAGVMNGSDGMMRPNDPITRQEAIVMIARAFGISGSSASLPFDDAGSVADWAKDLIAAMSAKGYINGSENKIYPNNQLTRAETVTILDNMIARLYSSSGTYKSETIKGNVMITAPDGVTLSDVIVYGDIIIGANVKGDVRLEFVREQGNIVNNGSATVLYAKNFAVNTFSLYGKEYPIDFTIRANMYNNVLFKKDESTGRIHYNSTLLTTAQGIDVSSHQKTIDWAAVAGDNIDFAMIRLGFRGYGSSGSLNVDNYFKNNINGAKANGLDVGVYFFSQAINVDEAIAEANFVLKHLNGMSLDYPVVFDWESVSGVNARTEGVSSETVSACAKAFCDTIAAAGYKPMIYFNLNDAFVHYNLSAVKNYEFWFAGYTSVPRFCYDMRIWQYTSSGKVAGIEGNVDMDLCFKVY